MEIRWIWQLFQKHLVNQDKNKYKTSKYWWWLLEATEVSESAYEDIGSDKVVGIASVHALPTSDVQIVLAGNGIAYYIGLLLAHNVLVSWYEQNLKPIGDD